MLQLVWIVAGLGAAGLRAARQFYSWSGLQLDVVLLD